MKKLLWMVPAGLAVAGAGWILQGAGKNDKIDTKDLVTGQQAFADYRTEKPGLFHKITAADLPKPYDTKSAQNFPRVVPKPENMWPLAPAGFKVELYTHEGLTEPRQIRMAPNGDFFVADSMPGEIKIFRGRSADGKPEQVSTFASGLKRPFGIAFYPVGNSPQWVYIGNTDSVVRFPYHVGDLKASASPETIIPELPPAVSTGRVTWSSRKMASACSSRLVPVRMSTIPTHIPRKCIAPIFSRTRPKASSCKFMALASATLWVWL